MSGLLNAQQGKTLKTFENPPDQARFWREDAPFSLIFSQGSSFLATLG
jgi:hypothetical protein